MAGTVDRLDFEISAKADKFTQAVDQATSKLDALTAKAQATASKVQGSNAGLEDSYFHVVDRLKLAAAAVDRFGAQTDALTGKQHTAWTGIATVVGGATGTMIERMTKFIDAAQKASEAVDSGFGKIGKSMWATTDALKVVNDRLENVNAKLEGRGPNLLKLQLDEARLAGDKLADSLDGDQQKATALLNQNHQAWYHALLHQGTTANIEGTVGSMQQQISDAGNQQQIDLHRGDTGAAGKDRGSIDSGLKYLADKMSGTIAEIDRNAAAGKGPDRKVERSEAVGVLAQTNARQDDLAAQDQSKVDTAANQRDVDVKEAADKRKAAAAAAAEAMRQAAEKQFQGFEDVLNKRKAAEQVDAASEAAYWESKLGPAQKYSENIGKVYARLAGAQQGYYRELDELAAKAVEAQKHDTAVMQEQLRTLEELDKAWAEALHRDADAKAALSAVNVGNASGLAELITAHQAATGAISKYDAEVQMAALHASTYAAQLAGIAKEKAADDADSSLSPDQRKANQDTRDVKAAQIGGEADRTAYQDKAAEFYSTGVGGMTQALQEFIAAARDSSAQMKEFTSSSLSGINDVLLKQITTRSTGREFHQNLSNFGSEEFRKVAGIGLQKGESALISPAMKALGLAGKADGSSDKPFYVRMKDELTGRGTAGSVAGAIAGGAGSQKLPDDLLQALYPAGDAASAGAAATGSTTGGVIPASGTSKNLGSMIGIASKLLGFLPGFASGTAPLSAGTMAMVGENGPEMAYLPKGTGVVPNHRLEDVIGGNGGQHHTWNIDARGSNDPAEMDFRIQHAIKQAAPHLTGQAVRAVHEQRKRSPGSRG